MALCPSTWTRRQRKCSRWDKRFPLQYTRLTVMLKYFNSTWFSDVIIQNRNQSRHSNLCLSSIFRANIKLELRSAFVVHAVHVRSRSAGPDVPSARWGVALGGGQYTRVWHSQGTGTSRLSSTITADRHRIASLHFFIVQTKRQYQFRRTIHRTNVSFKRSYLKVKCFFIIFLLFNSQVEGILYTTAKKFILKYNLGRPLAGNFYLCEYDWQSNITLAKLGPIPEYAQNAFTLAALEREQKKNIVINLKWGIDWVMLFSWWSILLINV